MFEGGCGEDLEALAAAAPGPGLAATLADIDLLILNGHARVVVMQAWERQASWASAGLYEAMGYVARSPMCVPDSPAELTEHFTEFASVEIGAALSMSPRGADVELSLAFQLAERLPATRAALAAGRINLAMARVIAHETSCLSDALARAAEDFILALADGLNRQQLERRLRRKVLQLDPEGAEERRKDARQGRRVRFDAGSDGTGCIAGYDLPIAEVAGARAFIKDLAKTLRRGGDGRTLEQLETDVFLDLLQGRHLDARSAQVKVEVVAPLETWLRLGAEPAELAGLGVISAEVMDEFLGTGGAGVECAWTVTSHGVVIRHGRGRYQPSRAQRRLIETLHRTCRHPGCSRPATSCDLDHVMEYRLGGPTCYCNLIPLCRRHHRAKHQAGWWWTRAVSGALQAQSPLGHTYDSTADALPGSDPPARTEHLTQQEAGTPF